MYHLRVMAVLRGEGRIGHEEHPAHVKLTLPDGSRLTAVAYSQEDYPGINLYLSREGHPEELICFVEFNREKQAGENICIGAYQPDVDDTVYYELYRVKGGQL